jgi:hypothetical protein
MSRRYPHLSEIDYERLSGKKVTPQPQEPRTGSRQRKFHNTPTVVNGYRFDSKREAQRAQELMLMEKAGLITDLVLDKRKLRYPLIVNGQKIATYTADARYMEHGELVVEDVKSKPTKTREYRRNKKWMRALYGIEIHEVY